MKLKCSILIAIFILHAGASAANTTSKLSRLIDLDWIYSRSVSSQLNCGKCSPCWNLFDPNYGLCSGVNCHRASLVNPQPICLDTLILLIGSSVGTVILVPVGLWFLFRAVTRYYDNDTKYIIDALIISWIFSYCQSNSSCVNIVVGSLSIWTLCVQLLMVFGHRAQSLPPFFRMMMKIAYQ